MLCDVVEDIKDITDTSNETHENHQIDKIGTTPEKGRVWRWSNTSTGLRKNTEGPVLRPTVKPVKRFIPEVNFTASSNSSSQNQNSTTQKQVASTTNNDDNTSAETKTKRHPSSNSTNQAFQPNSNKKKRVREQWSIEDKNHFFEAVAIHGKDFEAIQKAIAQKHKKRGDESVVKTKDQVRHLFYRTWTTINKLLNHEAPSNHNVKGSHEVLAVINYGELRKKLGGCILKKKGIMKLNELINYGSTSVRVKGKNYRIKTPSCKALKRIHDLEGAAKKSSVIETRRVKLPLRVILELHPLSMSAWNHVHLLAHNPRLRFNVPLDCHLSYLLSYLNKKWQTLSAKMFNLAHHEASGTESNSKTLQPSNRIEIHIPPEMSVKAKYQVHEIMNTKTHCIVTYVVHKSGKQMSKKKKKEVEISETHPIATVAELCNSSEDEAGFVDHTSDGEEHLIHHTSTPTEELEKTVFDDTKDEEHKGGTDVDEGTDDDVTVGENFLAEFCFDRDILSPDEKETDKVVNSFFQETEIFAKQLEIGAPTTDVVDSSESASSNVAIDSFPEKKNVEGATSNFAVNHSPEKESGEISFSDTAQKDFLEKNDEEAMEHTSLNQQKSSSYIVDISKFCPSPDIADTPELLQCFGQSNHLSDGQDSCPSRESLASPSFPTELPSSHLSENIGAEDVVESDTANITEADSPVKPVSIVPLGTSAEDMTETDNATCNVIEADSPVKPVPILPIQKVWDSETVGNISLAELYLMLGKPSMFKLCYQWKEEKQQGKLLSLQSDKSSNRKLSTSITALVQYASLLLSKMHSNNAQNSLTNMEYNYSDTKLSQPSGVNVGVQCSLLDKNDAGSNRKSLTPFVTKKSQPKATKRSAENGEFAVPNSLPRRKRRNQSTFVRKTVIAGGPQGGQVRLSDVEFRKQMDALNRRIDLFRTKKRTGGGRKPLIVQRTMMPNAKSVRKMMTLSIDPLGTHRVGFLPVTNQISNSAEPELEAVGATISSSKSADKSWSPDVTGAQSNDALGRVLPTSNQSSVLAQAAEEAGLFRDTFPSQKIPDLANGVASEEKPETSKVISSNQSELFAYQSAEVLSVASDNDVSADESERSLMIKNDVILPIRPPTPSVDSLTTLFDLAAASNDLAGTCAFLSSDDGGRNTPALLLPALDLSNTPQKPFASPIHPWSINCNSRDGLSGFATLNTPQRILPSDAEDSMDSLIFNLAKKSRGSDAEINSQVQYLMNDDSVDYFPKFRATIMQSNDDAPTASCKSVLADAGESTNENS